MTQPHTLYVFGTGNATMTRYYNTCFAIRSGEEYFMTDAGGGNGILRILEEMQVPLNRIHHLFVTHEHTDHILGVIWMIRMIGTAIKKGNYEGIFHIYCHDGLIDTIQTFCRLTLQKKFCDLIGDPIQLIPVLTAKPGRFSIWRSPSLTFIRPRRASSASAPCCRTARSSAARATNR